MPYRKWELQFEPEEEKALKKKTLYFKTSKYYAENRTKLFSSIHRTRTIDRKKLQNGRDQFNK